MNFLIVDSRFVVWLFFFLQGLTKVFLSWLPNYACFNSQFIVGFGGAVDGMQPPAVCTEAAVPLFVSLTSISCPAQRYPPWTRGAVGIAGTP